MNESLVLSGALQKQSWSILWDFENCPIPAEVRGTHVVNTFKNYVRNLDGNIKHFNAFGNLMMFKQDIRAELQQCGVLLHDIPTGKPSATDVALMVEFLKLVLDCPPPHGISTLFCLPSAKKLSVPFLSFFFFFFPPSIRQFW